MTEARSFLHHQVRNFVGTLKLVGEGPLASRAGRRGALHARDRAAAGPTAPPDGLSLIGVSYPDNPFGDLRANDVIAMATDASIIPID